MDFDDEDEEYKMKQEVLFKVEPKELFNRILLSFIPPVGRFSRVYSDLLGPLLAVCAMVFLLNAGYLFKPNNILLSPNGFMCIYISTMIIIMYLTLRFHPNHLDFVQLISLAGYSLYGHILAIGLPFLFFPDNRFFFLCLIIFGGSSTFKPIIAFNRIFHAPVFRLLIGTIFGLIQLLAILFTHLAYMHPTFIYGGNVEAV